ncbi:hypothetical protein ABPG72_020913 [Tetrahymena utriculariae]
MQITMVFQKILIILQIKGRIMIQRDHETQLINVDEILNKLSRSCHENGPVKNNYGYNSSKTNIQIDRLLYHENKRMVVLTQVDFKGIQDLFQDEVNDQDQVDEKVFRIVIRQL